LTNYPIKLGYISEQTGQICEIVNSQFADLRWFVRNERYPVPGRDHLWSAVWHAAAFLLVQASAASAETEQAAPRLSPSCRLNGENSDATPESSGASLKLLAWQPRCGLYHIPMAA
jgi:hypothetical protein